MMNTQHTLSLFCFFLFAIGSLNGQATTCLTDILSVDFPVVVRPSEQIQVSVTIKNNEPSPQTATLGLYQFSRGLKFPGPLPGLQAEGTVVSLAANETKTVTFNMTMPDYFEPYPRLNYEGNSYKWVIMTQEVVDSFFLYRNCFFEVIFDIQPPEANLGIRLVEKAYCLDDRGLITLDFEVKNEGSTIVPGPLFVGRSICFEFGSDGLPGLCLQRIDEDLAPGQSVIVQQSYNYYQAIYQGGGPFFSAYINEAYSNITNTNPIENAGKNISDFDFCESGNGSANCDGLGFYAVDDEIRVMGLLTAYAKVEIIGANTNWQVQTICEGDCSTRVVIPNLKNGDYTVKVQLNGADGSDCYRERMLTVESDGGNMGGNPVTIDCDQLQFIAGEGQIEVQNLMTTSKVEIIGAPTNWQVVTICDGNCAANQVIPNLSEGEYSVKVNQFGANEEYCYREEKVQVGKESGGNGSNESIDCDNLTFSSTDNQIQVQNAILTSKIEIIGANTNWQIVTICDGDCNENQLIPNLSKGEYAVKVNQFGANGDYCYREEKVQVGGETGDNTGGGNTGGNNDNFTCEALNFTANNGQIIIENLNPDNSKVEYIGRNTNWIPQRVCEGDCQTNQTISILSEGEYTVKVNQLQSDGSYCYREMKVTVGAGSRASQAMKEAVRLFPNPVKNRFYLDTHLLAGQSGRVLIYNSFGQVVYENKEVRFPAETLEIDASALENGLHYLFIQAEGRRAFSQKLVKESYR
ncbi:MAG: T9SS type A sorting domain-containing protein [Bacteroidota bacterium]